MTENDTHTRRASRRTFPWALAVAAALTVPLELAVAASAPHFMNDQWIQLGEKLRWVESDAVADVLVLGDSSTTAALRPDLLETRLGSDVRVVNLGLTATGHVGGEMMLRRYLEEHPAPSLVVIAHSPISLTNEPPDRFPKYPLAHLLGPAEMLRAARDSRDVRVALVWLATRLPSYRYRNGLVSGAASVLLDWSPRLRHRVYALLGIDMNALARERFDWGFTGRAARNAGVLERVREGRGWYYAREYAIEGERLPVGHRYEVPPFRAVRRESRALVRTLDLARDAGVPVLMVPAPLPARLVAALRADGGGRRLDSFHERLRASRPDLRAAAEVVMALEHSHFADTRHVHPEGAAHYTRRIAPYVRETLLGAR